MILQKCSPPSKSRQKCQIAWYTGSMGKVEAVDVEVLPPESPVKHPSEDKPWLYRPGQSGNPRGRPPKGESMAELAREILEEVHPAEEVLAKREERAPRSNKRAILDVVLRRALTGDLAAATFLFGRAYGAPAKKIEVEGRVDHVGSLADPAQARAAFDQRLKQLRDKSE